MPSGSCLSSHSTSLIGPALFHVLIIMRHQSYSLPFWISSSSSNASGRRRSRKCFSGELILPVSTYASRSTLLHLRLPSLRRACFTASSRGIRLFLHHLLAPCLPSVIFFQSTCLPTLRHRIRHFRLLGSASSIWHHRPLSWPCRPFESLSFPI